VVIQIKRWLAKRATELNGGVEDPVLVGYVVNMLEEKVTYTETLFFCT
jgi:hypothetical protein